MRTRGYSLLELIVVVVLFGLLGSLLTIYLRWARHESFKTSCASNLNQLAKSMFMYADVLANGAFPCASKDPDKADAMASLGLLYNRYMSRTYCFSCASSPVPLATLEAIRPTGPAISSYGYDPHHGPNDEFAAIMADRKGDGKNSDNHGPDAGQNVMIGAGVIEFFESPVRKARTDAKGKDQPDPDIFSLNPEIPREMDGFIRQK